VRHSFRGTAAAHERVREGGSRFGLLRARLDGAREERSAWLAYLAVDPRLDAVRDDERLAALLGAVELAL